MSFRDDGEGTISSSTTTKTNLGGGGLNLLQPPLTMRNRPKLISPIDENPISHSTSYTTYNNSKYSSSSQQQYKNKSSPNANTNNRWILVAIIAIPLILLFIFSLQLSRTETVEWESVQEEIPNLVGTTLDNNHHHSLLKRSKLAIVSHVETVSQMEWIEKEYLDKLEMLREGQIIVTISMCANLQQDLHMSKFSNAELSDVFRILTAKKCQTPSLIANGLKVASKLAEYVLILEPGFSIFVDKQRVDSLLKEIQKDLTPTRSGKSSTAAFVDYGLLVVNVMNSQQPKQNVPYFTNVEQVLSKSDRIVNRKLQSKWVSSSNLLEPIISGTGSSGSGANLQQELPELMWFLFATSSPEDNPFQLKNSKIIEMVRDELEKKADEMLKIESTLTMVDIRKLVTKLFVSHILESYNAINKEEDDTNIASSPPPIYYAPSPYTIEWKPSHDFEKRSTELLENGLTFATYCTIAQIPLIHDFIKRLSEGDNLVVSIAANSQSECASEKLTQLVSFSKKVKLDYKCIVISPPPSSRSRSSQAKQQQQLPLNLLRNEAILMTRTKWIAIVEPNSVISKYLNRDFLKLFVHDKSSKPLDKLDPIPANVETRLWKSPQRLMQSYPSLSQYLEKEKVVFVVPSFVAIDQQQEQATDNGGGGDIPQEFTTLKKALFKGDEYTPIDSDDAFIDISRYISVSSQGQKAYQIKASYPFEPMIIGQVSHLPLYTQDNTNDRIIYHAHLVLQKFQYFVLPRHFAIQQVSKTVKRKRRRLDTLLQKLSLHYPQQLLSSFRKEAKSIH